MFEYEYPRPCLTVDAVLFTVRDGLLHVLTIRRDKPPFVDGLALPGGHVESQEGLEDAVLRELAEECFAEITPKALAQVVRLEQLYTFGTPFRDPRGHYITVAYFGLVPYSALPRLQRGSDAKETAWMPISLALEEAWAFDHLEIVQTALTRLRGKIDYTPLAAGLLSSPFTRGELRRVYEIIKGNTYDPRNFNRRFRRMTEDGFFAPALGARETGGRPASLWQVVGGSDGVG